MAPQRGPQKSAAPKRRRKVAPPTTRAPVSDVRTGTGYRRPNAARIAPTRAPRSDVRTGTGYRRPKPAPAPRQRAPISDIRSSTGRGTYGRRRPERIYRRESYQRDLRAAELSKLANRIRSNRLEPVKPRKGFIESTFQAFYPRRDKDTPKGQNPRGVLASGGGVGGQIASPISRGAPFRVVQGMAVATKEDPFGVAGNTAKGGVEIIAGTLPGIADLLRNPTHATRIPGAVAKDFSRRYGPLARGDDREFIERLKREGLAPELLDTTAILGPAVGGTGKALAAPARAGRFGERAQRIATERPALRLSENLVVEQEVSPNLFRAAAQAGEDRVRGRVAPAARRVAGKTPGIQPRRMGPVTREGRAANRPEVAPVFQGREGRIRVSRRQARSYLANRREQAIELSKGAERDIATLKPAQREAALAVMSGMVPLAVRKGENRQQYVSRVRAQLVRRRDQIDKHVASDPKLSRATNPQAERNVLDRLIDNTDEVFGDGAVAQFYARNAPRSKRLATGDPAVSETRLQPAKVQGEVLGMRYEPPPSVEDRLQALRSDKRSAGIKEQRQLGRAETVVPMRNRAVLREDPQVRAAVRERSAAQKELTLANRKARNEQRMGSVTPAASKRLAAARARLQVAKVAHADALSALEKRAGAARAKKAKGGRLTAAERRLLSYDRAPGRTLSGLEATRGKKLSAEEQIRALGTEEGQRAVARELGQYDEHYIRQVRRAAQQAGLPEGAYFRHQEFPTSGFGERTAANLYRATAGPQQSKLELLRRGAAITDPDVFVQGLAGNIKRKHQWNAVADVLADNAASWSRGRSGGGRSLLDIKREIARQGLNPDDYEFINFGRFRRYAEELNDDIDSPNELRDALEDAVTTSAALRRTDESELARTRGFVAVPKGVGSELKEATRPAGKPGRFFGAVQGLQSAVILGLNPSWLQMQVAANTLQYGFGSRGNPFTRAKDLLEANDWYRGLPDDLKARIDEVTGVGVGTGHGSAKLGSQGGRFVQAAQQIGQIPLVRSQRGTIRVTDLKPTDLLFRVDEKQNAAFRRALLYNDAKRMAYRDMRRELGQAAKAQEQVSKLLTLKRGEQLEDQIRRVIENPEKIEKLAAHVDRVLGDFTRYTARERRFLKPALLFYGFLRFSLKTLFYTLPVRHPVAASLVGKIGQLSNEEVRELFGARDLPPWIFSRLFLSDKGELRRDSNGNPQAIDFARLNPTTNVLTDVVEASAKNGGEFNLQPLTGLLSPLNQAVVGQVVGKDLFTDKGFRVAGQTERGRPKTIGQSGRIVAADLLGSAFPYRTAMNVLNPETQGDDSLIIDPRPVRYKTPGSQAKEAQRLAVRPSVGRQLGEALVPFGFPRADTTEAYLREHPPSQPLRQPRRGPRTPEDREREQLLREADLAAEEEVSERERQALLREAFGS